MKLLPIIILGLLPSCVVMHEEGSTFAALGGKGAYKKGVGVVYDNEDSFRVGAATATAIGLGITSAATSKAQEITTQVSNTNAAKTAQKTAEEAAKVKIIESNNAVKMAELVPLQ